MSQGESGEFREDAADCVAMHSPVEGRRREVAAGRAYALQEANPVSSSDIPEGPLSPRQEVLSSILTLCY